LARPLLRIAVSRQKIIRAFIWSTRVNLNLCDFLDENADLRAISFGNWVSLIEGELSEWKSVPEIWSNMRFLGSVVQAGNLSLISLPVFVAVRDERKAIAVLSITPGLVEGARESALGDSAAATFLTATLANYDDSIQSSPTLS
jgi:hypothetical protein